MSFSTSCTFGRWCIAFFMWLSFVNLALGIDGAIYNYTVNCGDVSVTRGSASPTPVPIHVLSNLINISVAMTIGFHVSSKEIQCQIEDHSCDHNVSLNSNGTTYIFLRAPVSRDEVIQDTVVTLEPIVQDSEVTLVQESDGTTWKENVTRTHIKWDGITVTLRDDRRLRVGFTRSDTVHFDKNGMAKLYVMNFDTPLRLTQPLLMSIIVRCSDDKSYVSQTVTNISFPEHNISAPILIVDQELDYSQHYEATIETQSNNVQLDPSTVQIAYNPYVKLMEDMKILEAIMTSVQTELQVLKPVVENSTIAASTTAETSTTTKSDDLTTETTTTATATTKPISDSDTTVDTTTTTINSNQTTITKPTTTAKPTAEEASSIGTTGSVEKSNLSTTEEDVETAEGTDSNDTFMWWILAGFVVLMVVTVSGYLLYNHRAKVMVYVGSVWKSNSDKLPTTGQPNRRKNKYTPLPTSIHDTLTHED